MFEFIMKWFKNPQATEVVKKTNKSDEIRKYVKNKFIIPARVKKAARVTFTALDVAKGMGLEDRYPMVCSSIDAKKFLEYARVDLIKREGAAQGSTAKWTFKLK